MLDESGREHPPAVQEVSVGPMQPTISRILPSICAKLVTVNNIGRKEGGMMLYQCFITFFHGFLAIVLSLNKPVTIGRNPSLWCVVGRHSSTQ